MDVSSPVRKLVRAREHIHELQEAQREWRETDFYEVVTHSNLGESADPEVRVMWKIRVVNPPPGTWSAIAGDIVTNLRAALDHALYSVVAAAAAAAAEIMPALERRIQFPIEDDAASFANRVKPYRNYLTDDIVEIIEREQPYRDEAPSPLLWVRELSNRDKHRGLVITPVVATDFTFTADVPGLNVKLKPGDAIEDGKTIALARFPRPVGQSHFDTQQRFEWIEHIETHTNHGPMPASVVIESMYQTVLHAVAALIHDIASDLDVWVIRQELDAFDERWENVKTSLTVDPDAAGQ